MEKPTATSGSLGTNYNATFSAAATPTAMSNIVGPATVATRTAAKAAKEQVVDKTSVITPDQALHLTRGELSFLNDNDLQSRYVQT